MLKLAAAVALSRHQTEPRANPAFVFAPYCACRREPRRCLSNLRVPSVLADPSIIGVLAAAMPGHVATRELL